MQEPCGSHGHTQNQGHDDHTPGGDYGTPVPDGDADVLHTLLTRLVRDTGLLHPEHTQHDHTGLSVSQSEGFVLMELADSAHPLAQRDLAIRLNLEKSTISRLLAGLERRDLVQQTRNPVNQRLYELRLTPHGRTLADAVSAAYRENHEQLITALNPTERSALAVGLEAFLRELTNRA